MTKYASFLAAIALCLAALTEPAQALDHRLVAVVMLARHGVRNPTKPIAGYAFPAWYSTPNSDGYLSKHGYDLAAEMGRFDLALLRANGLLPAGDCDADRVFAWADTDQRTYETARAMLSTMSDPQHCSGEIALEHASAADALFHGGPGSETRDAAVKGVPPSAQSAIDAVTTIVAPRCNVSPCAPVQSLSLASTLSENMSLEYAQCRTVAEMMGRPNREFPTLIQHAMRAHTLWYEVHQRSHAFAIEQGSNLFAHIVALLDDAAGRSHAFADAPEMHSRHVALIVGHDGNIASIAGMLDAHWQLASDMIADDTPPLGTMVFDLYKDEKGQYSVGLRFVSQSYDQMRHARPIAGGTSVYPVTFASCSGSPCTVPLTELDRMVTAPASASFIERNWPAGTPEAMNFPPLEDPAWTKCSE